MRRGGFLESLIPAAINFATNAQSALNVGSFVKDVAVSGMNIKKTIDNVKATNKAKEDIKKFRALEFLNDLYD